MKKIKILIASILCGGFAYGQAPTGAPPTNINNTNLTATSAWYRGGNFAAGSAGTNNIFGTAAGFNSPIYTQTNGVQRSILRGGGTGNNAGRMALGNNLPNNFTPRARLHLHQNGGFTNLRFTTITVPPNTFGYVDNLG